MHFGGNMKQNTGEEILIGQEIHTKTSISILQSPFKALTVLS